jgi:hypothetical protein
MPHMGSINRLLSVMILRSHRSPSQRRTDWTLVLALACTAMTVASAISLVYFHYFDGP